MLVPFRFSLKDPWVGLFGAGPALMHHVYPFYGSFDVCLELFVRMIR